MDNLFLSKTESKGAFNHERLEVITRNIALASSVILILFSLSAMIGWELNIEYLYRYRGSAMAIVFNTAVSFILLGIAVIAYFYNGKLIVDGCCSAALILAILPLMEHLFAIDLKVDNLFFQHYDSTHNVSPGRMAPITSWGFIFISCGLLSLNNARLEQINASICGGSALLVGLLALIILVGFNYDSPYLYFIALTVVISSAALVGFVILSVSVFFAAFYTSLSRHVRIINRVPVYIFVSLCAITLFLTEKIGEYDLLNNMQSNLPLILLMVGLFLSTVLTLLTHFVIKENGLIKDLQVSLTLMQALLETTEDGVIVLRLDNTILTHNKRYNIMWNIGDEDLSNYTIERLRGIVGPQVIDGDIFIHKIRELRLMPDDMFRETVKLKNGSVYNMLLKPHVINNVIVGRVFRFTDVTEQYNLIEKLERQATHDLLTGLPNRILLQELIIRSIEQAKKNNTIVCVAYLDVDSFRDLNNLFGRDNGDLLIKDIVVALQDELPAHVVLGHLGQDKFVLIGTNLTRMEMSYAMVTTLQNIFKRTFKICGQEVSISCCIGVAVYPADGLDAESLLSHAELALARAKKIGKNNFQFYAREMNAFTLERATLELQLLKAVSENTMLVYYQPIISLESMRPVAVEALARLRGENDKIVPPNKFIPLAEEMGIISQLGANVMIAACKQMKEWERSGVNGISLSLNISAQQCKHDLIIRTVNEAIEQSSLDPNKLQIEIKEDALIAARDEMINVINRLTNIGVNMSFDNFGAGYVGFYFINQFPFKYFKIDRGFIERVEKSVIETEVLHNVINMCKAEGYIVVAVGVETLGQLNLVKSLGFDLAQGFYFSTPLPPDECKAYLLGFRENKND